MSKSRSGVPESRVTRGLPGLELLGVDVVGQEGPLAEDARPGVQHLEDALEPQVRHADVVEVGVDEGDLEGAPAGTSLQPHLRLAEGPVVLAEAAAHAGPFVGKGIDHSTRSVFRAVCRRGRRKGQSRHVGGAREEAALESVAPRESVAPPEWLG